MRGRDRGRPDCCGRSTCRRGILPQVVEPGTVVGRIGGDAPAALRGTPRRRARVPRHRVGCGRRARPTAHRAFLSSGTWSLLGTELDAPVITVAGPRAQLHQRRRRLRHDPAAEEHRRSVAAAGVPPRTGPSRGTISATTSLLALAADSRPAFRSLVRSRSPVVSSPAQHGRGDRRLLPRDRPAGARSRPPAYARAILESLAFKYRVVLESMRGAHRAPPSPRSASSAAARATGC